MINVQVSPKGYKVKITGHAKYADKGNDIVCAAVSFAYYNLCQMVLEFERNDKLSQDSLISDNEGDASVEAVPKKEHENEIRLAFTYFKKGIELLSAKYPEFVRVN